MAHLNCLFGLLILALTAQLMNASHNCRGRVCGYHAHCPSPAATHCVCNQGFVGYPNFICYRPAYFSICDISSDPVIWTFDKQVSRILIPASLCLARVKAKRFGKGSGNCHVDVTAWTAQFYGKNYIEGLQFRFRQTDFLGTIRSDEEYRITAEVKNRVPVWKVEKKVNGEFQETFTVGGLKSPPPPIGCITFLRTNDFLVVRLTCCGVSFGIRAFNPHNQLTVPGVFVKVLHSAMTANLPEFLCNALRDGKSIDDLKNKLRLESRQQTMTLFGLMYGRPLFYPRAFPKLQKLQLNLVRCSDERLANLMIKAEFLFDNVHLKDCMQGRIMDAIYHATRWFCNGDKAACHAIVKNINTFCPNVRQHAKMEAFMKHGCD